MKNMYKITLAISLLSIPLFLCSCTETREGLGGGAKSPVRVTILTDGGDEPSAETGADASTSAAEKITTFGTFRGRITVNGEAPKLTALVPQGKEMKDTICSVNAVDDESIIVGNDGGLKNVYVYLRRVPNVDVPPPPTDEILVDQKGCKFIPHAMVCRKGQPIKLLNSDPVGHNVKISSNSLIFNQILGEGDSAVVQYDREEKLPIAVGCDIHAWMQVYQLPLEHPWFALTGDDGSFVIENVPAGKMEIVVWHEKAFIERAVAIDIPANGEATRDFTVNVADFK